MAEASQPTGPPANPPDQRQLQVAVPSTSFPILTKKKKKKFHKKQTLIQRELSELRDSIDKMVDTMVNKLTGEDEVSVNMRATVIDDVAKLPGLTRPQVIEAAAAMSVADNNWLLKFFYRLKNDEDRCYFVMSLLKDKM
ncbi:hypothetical protein LINGRAHAP2_LOCUS17838 [Linum grandiflorum]